MQFLHRDSYPFRYATASDEDAPLVQIAFVGKGVPRTAPGDFGAAVGALLPDGVEPAWLRQVHSADVVETGRPGACGDADALVTGRTGLALVVVTADCVPVLLAGSGAGNGSAGAPRIAAVHAGWRGVASGIVARAAARFAVPPRVAWIGPAISGAVYEVGPDVAEQVADVSDDSVVSLGANGREHVDLRRAVEIQLRAVGVEDVRQVDRCTFRDDSLWSYRRDGKGAGRNLAVIWLEP